MLKRRSYLPPTAPLLPEVDAVMDESLESGMAALADLEMD